jgi:hypothetical protein
LAHIDTARLCRGHLEIDKPQPTPDRLGGVLRIFWAYRSQSMMAFVAALKRARSLPCLTHADTKAAIPSGTPCYCPTAYQSFSPRLTASLAYSGFLAY